MEQQHQTNDRLQGMQREITDARDQYRKGLRNVRIYIGIIILSTIFIALDYTVVPGIPTWVVVFLWIAGITSIFGALATDLHESKADIHTFESKRNVFLGIPEPADDSDKYFDRLVKINLENLAAYYALVKSHTAQSFNVSLWVGVIGFLLLGAGLVIGFQFETYQNISYLASGSGLLIEFISGVLFYLYNRTVRQLKVYHDSLIDVQNVLLSFKLIGDTKDEKLKSEMMGKMIEYLVGGKSEEKPVK